MKKSRVAFGYFVRVVNEEGMSIEAG